MGPGLRVVLFGLSLNYLVALAAAESQQGERAIRPNRRALEVGLNLLGFPLKFTLGGRKKVPLVDENHPGALQTYERRTDYGGDFSILGIPFGINFARITDDYRHSAKPSQPVSPSPPPLMFVRRYLPSTE